MTNEIDYESNRFIVLFPYNARLVAAVKSIPGRLFNGQNKNWSVPIKSHESLAK